MDALSPASVLFATAIALPYLLFVALNEFKSVWLTLVRAVVSVALGWVYFVAYAQAVQAISYQSAKSGQDLELLFQGDGAAAAFSALFGWVIPAIVVGLAWAIHSPKALVEARRLSNR